MQLEAGLVAGGPHSVTVSPRPSRSARQSGATSALGRGEPGAVGTHVPWGDRLSMLPALRAGQGSTQGKAGTPGLGTSHWTQSLPVVQGLRTGCCSLGPRASLWPGPSPSLGAPCSLTQVPGEQTGGPEAVAGQGLWSQPPWAGGCSRALTGLDCPFVEARGEWARACWRADPTSSCGTTSEPGDPPTQCQEAQGRAGTTPLGSSESSL